MKKLSLAWDSRDSIRRAHTKDIGERARVEEQKPLMIRVEEVVPSSQERSAGDFIVHAARSCSERVRVLRPRRLW